MTAGSELRGPAVRLPGGWPLLGHLAAFRRDRLGLLTACGRAGDVVTLRLGPWRTHVLSHPSLVREVLVSRQDAFVKSPALRAARALLGDGLLTSEGEVHRRHRRLVQPALGRDRLGHLGASVARHADRVTVGWADGAVVDVHAALRDLTLGVAAETIFGTGLDGDAAVLSGALDELLDAYDSPLLPLARFAGWLPLPRLRRWQAARRRIGEVVRARAAAGGGDGADVASALLDARDARGRLTAREVHDELVTLLLAGHETTASTLAWTCHLLAAHGDARARVEAEADAAGGDGAAALPAVDQVDELVWARAAVAEALRLYPPSWAMGRQARRDVLLGGHRVGRGDIVIASQWVVHRDARWWPRPGAFEPDRWVGGQAGGVPPFAYFPFGGGRRRCVGEPMAAAETVLALVALVRNWRLEVVAGAPEPRPQALLTLRPGVGVALRVTRRRAAARARR